MKWSAVIILLSLVLGVIIPPAIQVSTGNTESSLGVLDLCHKAAPALFSNGEMPVIAESQSPLLPVVLQGTITVLDRSSKPLPLVFQDEIPPKA